jgi:hypothetical protein
MCKRMEELLGRVPSVRGAGGQRCTEAQYRQQRQSHYICCWTNEIINERYRFANTGNSAMRVVGVLGVALAGLFVIGAVTAYGQIDMRSQYEGTAAAVGDETGNLRVPADYRTSYQMLGSWAVAKDDGPGSKELHVVYASPGTIAAYRKDGHFPDGTVLVKEVFKTTTKDMTTGTVSSAGSLAGWFVR